MKLNWLALYRHERIGILENIHAHPLGTCDHNLFIQVESQADLIVPILRRSQNPDPISTALPGLGGLLFAHYCSRPPQWQ